MTEQILNTLFLATVNERMIEVLARPLERAFPAHFYRYSCALFYVALATGIALGLSSGINVFSDVLTDLSGKILTSILIGGGSVMIHETIGNRKNEGPASRAY